MTTRTREGLRQLSLLIVGLGALVALIGVVRLVMTYRQSTDGIETVAVIDRAWTYGSILSSNATLKLRWTDAAGKARQAQGISVSSGLRAKLIQDRRLTRTTLRIRYQADASDASVVVLENIGDQLASARAVAVAGFATLTLGSLLVLAGLAAANRAEATS